MWKNYTLVNIDIDDTDQLVSYRHSFLKLFLYLFMGDLKIGSDKVWIEWKDKELVLAQTFNGKLREAEKSLRDNISEMLYGG